jgi:hypothetical protein
MIRSDVIAVSLLILCAVCSAANLVFIIIVNNHIQALRKRLDHPAEPAAVHAPYPVITNDKLNRIKKLIGEYRARPAAGAVRGLATPTDRDRSEARPVPTPAGLPSSGEVVNGE